MATLGYVAIRPDGRIIHGKTEALSEEALANQLQKERLELVELRDADEISRFVRRQVLREASGREKITRRHAADLFFQLGTLLKAGVPLIQALEQIAIGLPTGPLQGVVRNLSAQVQSGASLHEAFSQFPRAFPPVVIALVQVADKTGTLPQVCAELRAYLVWLDRMMSDVKQAVRYPLIILGVAILFIFVIFSFVVPRFATILKEMKIPLPPLTQFVMGVSTFCSAYWWQTLATVGGLILGLNLLIKKSAPFRLWLDRIKLKLPVFGPVILMISITRFTQNLATMYRSGLLILDSLRSCRNLVGNEALADAVDRVHNGVAGGRKIAETMKETGLFPPLVLQMVATGENTGQLAEALQNVTDYYNEIIPKAIKQIFGIMEPVIMLGLIVLVGTVVLSVFLPITEMLKLGRG